MAFRAVCSLAPESRFKALPILGVSIGCLFLSLKSTQTQGRTRAYTDCRARPVRTRRHTDACFLPSVQPQFLACFLAPLITPLEPLLPLPFCPVLGGLALSHPFLFPPPAAVYSMGSGLRLPPQSSGWHQACPQGAGGKGWAASVPEWPPPSPAGWESARARSCRRCWPALSGWVQGSGAPLWPTAAILFSETKTHMSAGLSSVFGTC